MIASIESASRERVAAAWVLTTVTAILLWVFLTAFEIPLMIAGVIAAAVGAIATPFIARRLPKAWDGAWHRHRWLCVLWLLLGVVTMARVAGLALFMADPDLAFASTFWFDEFYIRHSCFSAYWEAALLVHQGVDNVYDFQHYLGTVGRFKLDEFLYMPQFLLLPGLGYAMDGGFQHLRAAWFAIEAVIVGGTMLAVCHWIGGSAGRRAALLIAALWVASPLLLTLQIGNYQLAAIAMSVLAMLLFERDRPIAGGALLGFAIFKLFPGVLGIYLLAARRWMAALWTFAFSILYTVVAYLWMGPKPFLSFLHYELPRIANGESWAFLKNDGMEAVNAINGSIPGLAMKLKMLGMEGMEQAAGYLAWPWTALVVILTIAVALKRVRMSRLELATTWLALLALISFRSPFLPDHNALFAPIWLWSLVVAAMLPSRRNVAIAVMAWVALAAVLPFSGAPLSVGWGRFVVSTTSQFVAIGLCLWVVVRGITRPGEVNSQQNPTHPIVAVPPVENVAFSAAPPASSP